MSGKRWAAIGIAALLFFVSIMVNMASSFLSTDLQSFFNEMALVDESFIEEVYEEGDTGGKIALLELDGVIQDTGETSSFLNVGYNHRIFMEQLNYAKDDNTVDGIIIRVNTPGGGVVESAEIHDKIVQIIEETEKPVYVSMGSMAASGGYYISAPATKIFATPETITGSLGVIMQSINYAELAEQFGVDFVTIKSGKYKDMMSPSREMTKEEREILTKMLDNSYAGFVNVIAEGRGMTEAEVRKIADGRIYDGRQAKELNLIDDFGYLEDVIANMRTEQDLEGAEVIRYVENLGFGFNSLFSLGANKLAGNELQLNGMIKILSEPNSPRPMYLYAE